MGESSYFPAYGARPQRGAGPDDWDYRDTGLNNTGHHHQAPAQDGWPQEPSLTSGRHAPQAPAGQYGAAPGPFAPPRQGHGAGGDPYMADLYAAAPYGRDGYAPDPYAPDPYAPEPYAPDPYAQSAYAPDRYAHAPARQPQFQRRDPFAEGHAAAPHGNGQAGPSQSPVAAPVSVAGLAQGVGAVMSLVLLVSGGVWAWQMMQRDVSGVPVVRALEGPLRVTPEDPGGAQAAHQGLSVTELAEDGPSELPDEIVLAPAPLDLDRELNTPAGDQTPPATGEERLIEVGLPMADTVAPETSAPLGMVRPNRLAVAQSPRPAPRGAQSAAPVPGASAPASGAETALAAAIANSVAADLSRDGGRDVDPASIGPGTRLVQLGTFESPTEARSAWDGLAQRFDPLLDDRGRVIEAAHSGGSVFYRLRAHGFSDERDARRFCAALIDQNMDCIPVLIR